MALNRWLGALLVVSVVGFTGCAQPTKKNTASTPTPAATTVAVAETPDAPETPDAAETPVATGTPAAAETPEATGTPAAAETPKDGGTTADSGRAALELDFEDADGMAGYDEVLAMEVPPSSPEVVAKGKEVFAANCATCHGDAGKGDGPAGANLDPPPRDLTAADDYKYGHMALAVYRTGAYGIEGTGMAPLGDVLEPDEMWAVTHYVETLQK